MKEIQEQIMEFTKTDTLNKALDIVFKDYLNSDSVRKIYFYILLKISGVKIWKKNIFPVNL